jgi:CBS domain containing-hemolysin-like protein
MEASLYSIGRARIETLKRQGDRKGVILASLRDKVDEPIAAILILNTVMNTAGSVLAGALVADHYGSAHLGLFSAAMTIAILFISEIIPKSLGFKFASRIAPLTAYPLKFLVWFLWPIVRLCVMLTNAFGRSRISAVTEDDIISMALMSHRHGSIEEHEAKWIANALHLDKVCARDLMTPGSVVRRVPADMPLSSTEADADHWSFSRIPVYMPGDTEQIVGVVHRREVFQYLIEGKKNLLMQDVMTPPIFIPALMPAHQLLNLFIKRRKHLFCVSEKGGRWVGIVTLEDVLEALIGTEIVGEQDLYEDMQEAARQSANAQVLTQDLKRGGGIIEHVIISDRSNLVGVTIKESGLPHQALVGPIVRDGAVIVPRGDVLLQSGDKIALIGARKDVEEAKLRLCPREDNKESTKDE